MYFDFREFKECLKTYLNPVELFKFTFDYTDNLLEIFVGIFMFIITIIISWGLLPLTLIISFLQSIKLRKKFNWS